MKKNNFILALILAILVLFWFYWPNIDETNSISTSDRTSSTPINDSAASIFSTQKGAEVDNKSKYKKDGFITPDFRPLQLTDLLNPDDRIERFGRYIDNHNHLLAIVLSLQTVQQNKININQVSINQIKQWTQTLINDVNFSNAIFQEKSVNIDVNNIEKFDISKLPSESNFTERLSIDYLKGVKNLAEQTQSLLDFGEKNSHEKSNIIRKIASLTKRTKKQSDVFYTTRMKRYFKGRDYTLQQKITFANGFVQAKDVQLMAAAKQYFEYAMQLSEYENQKAEIEKIITNLSRI
jgi:hypothetical protein